MEPGYLVIANIPYYITGLFLRKFLETEIQPSKIVVMVQKEIADRIVAKDGKESILSISVKAYGEPKVIMKVSRGSFDPMPNVDSAILEISDISENFFTQNGKKIDEKKFFEIVKAGFAHKRKILSANLKEILGENLPQIFAELNLSPNARAEDLKIQDWINLAK